MGTTPTILVIDCYDENGRQVLDSVSATPAGVMYRRVLKRYSESSHIEICEISQGQPPEIDPTRYAGVCWTGSNLFFSDADPVVQRHIDACRLFFEAGVPQFGSCWAAQLAAVATGGKCDQNDKGREFGVSRKIALTDAGKSHPMFAGKPLVFDALTSHADIITELPDCATLLAGNKFSPVQAIDVQFAAGSFWAVQYHPEYDCAEVAALSVARRDELIQQGSMLDQMSGQGFADDLTELQLNPSRTDLAWKLGLDDDVLDTEIREREVKNWVRHITR